MKPLCSFSNCLTQVLHTEAAMCSLSFSLWISPFIIKVDPCHRIIISRWWSWLQCPVQNVKTIQNCEIPWNTHITWRDSSCTRINIDMDQASCFHSAYRRFSYSSKAYSRKFTQKYSLAKCYWFFCFKPFQTNASYFSLYIITNL